MAFDAAMLAVICAVTGLCAWRMGSDYGLFGVAAIVIIVVIVMKNKKKKEAEQQQLNNPEYVVNPPEE